MEGNPAQGAQNHFYHKIYCFWVSKYLPHSHTQTHRGQHSVFDCSRGAQKCFINLQLLSIYWQHVAAASLQTQPQLGATNRQRWSRSKSRSHVGWQEEDKKVAREICLPALGQMCEEAAGQTELTHTYTHTVSYFMRLSFFYLWMPVWEMRTIYNRNCCVCIWITRRIRNQRTIAKSMTMTRATATTTTIGLPVCQVTVSRQQYKTNVIFYISIVFYDCAQSAHVQGNNNNTEITGKKSSWNCCCCYCCCCCCLPAVNLKLCV